MKFFILIFILSFSLFGCFEEGQLTLQNKGEGLTSLNQQVVLDYDAQKARLLLSGQINHPDIKMNNSVQFFSSSDCTGSSLGQTTYEIFKTTGFAISLPSQSVAEIYVKTNSLAYCMFLTRFTARYKTPTAPQLTAFSPASPTQVTLTPLVQGSVEIPSYQVKFFSDANCTQSIGQGSAKFFNSTGLVITITENQTTSVYSKAVDAFGQESSCALMGSYTHNVVGPAVPTFIQTEPLSPSRISADPLIKGSASVDTDKVTLFSDASCTTSVGEGPRSEFISSGVTVHVEQNSTTYLYAKAVDIEGRASRCVYFTTYIHDIIAPTAAPVFVAASPASPTRLTTYPRISGTTTADTAQVIFYNNPACLSPIGTGTKAQFESTGINAGVTPNAITTIYAVSLDAAGNRSPCATLTFYKHNTIPPDSAVYSTSLPISPNNKTASPKLFGNSGITAVTHNFYNDDKCLNLVGTGPANIFDTLGIQVVLPENTNSTLYSRSIDPEGNISVCNFLANYDHSNLPADPAFFGLASPASPSRISATPYINGTTSAKVVSVEIFSDSSCSQSVGQGSRLTFLTSGVRVNLSSNAITDLYSITTDKYGNTSTCNSLTQFIHCSVQPDAPVMTSYSPLSPSRLSVTPAFVGTTTQNVASVLAPNQVSLYDSMLCINRIGDGPVSQFTSTGVIAALNPNALNTVYARAFDAAGNYSSCQFFSNYIHDDTPPGNPSFTSATPQSPSYSENTLIVGSILPKTKVLPISSVNIFSDSSCSNLISSESPSAFTSTGIPTTVGLNTTTTLYGQTLDSVGNKSSCVLFNNFMHSNSGPTNVTATQNNNGSVNLSWYPDTFGNPVPTYIIKRSLYSGGPYTVINPINFGNTFVDNSVNHNKTYYYVVATSNNTGTTLDSAEVQITVNSPNPGTALNLIAFSGMDKINLQWNSTATDMTFKVYRSLQSGGPYTLVSDRLDSTVYTDGNTLYGQSYYYTVVGVNPYGVSLTSNEAQARSEDIPSAPLNLQIELVPYSTVCNGQAAYLTWTAPSYYNSFNIYRDIYPGTIRLLRNVSTNSAVDCIGYAEGSRNHYYNVEAIWGGNSSAKSNEVSIYNATVGNFQVVPGDSEILLSWTANGSSSYSVYRADSASGPFTLLTSGVSSPYYTDSTAVNNQPYYYYVVGNTANGDSIPSIVSSAMPSAFPSAPSNLNLTLDTNNFPFLNWSPVKSNYYKIYRSSSLGGTYTLYATSSSAYFSDTAPLLGVGFYKITAVWGNSETAATNIVNFRNGVISGLVATTSASAITLNWTSFATATNYDVYRSTTANTGFSFLANSVTNSYVDSSAAAGQGYYYYVIAKFADATAGLPSATVKGMIRGITIPSGLTVTGYTQDTITIAWAPVFNNTAYRVLYSTTLNGTYVSAGASTTATTYTITGLNSVTTYYFKVTATVSGVQSSRSNAVAGTTLTDPPTPFGVPGNNLVDLNWSPITGANSYSVLRSTDNINYSTIASGTISFSYTDNSAVNGTTYFYKILADFGVGTTLSTASLPVTPGVTPNAPKGLSVVGNSNGTDITLQWVATANSTSYQVFVSTTSGVYSTPYLSTPSTNTIISGLTPNTVYYFVVKALNGTNPSTTYSNEVAAYPSATSTAPTGLAVTNTQIDITWSPIAGASTYRILRSSDGYYYSEIATGVSGTTYSDSTVTNSQTYSYKYQPYTASSLAMAVSLPSSWITTEVMPLPIKNLMAEALDTSTVELNWVPSLNVTQYQIFRSSSPGGPYTNPVATISSLLTTYTDTGVTPGSTYYYIVKAVNSSGLASADSNEVSVRLVAGPANLVGTNGQNKIDLTWGSVASATGYTVRRSLLPGGPYGSIARGLTTTSFSDTAIEHGLQYYYVVDAEFGVSYSVHSNEANVSSVDQMNLQVPIELIDRGLWSTTSAQIFNRSQTTLDTDAYDGTITYEWQIVAQNFHTSSLAVQIINGSNQVVGTITVPASTSAWTRIKSSFNPTAGTDIYRLKMPASPQIGDLQVSSARLLITQNQATKTRIYIPLTASSSIGTEQDDEGFLEEISDSTFKQLSSSSLYVRNTSVFSHLKDFNAWELETLTSVKSGARGAISFINQTQNTSVGRTQSLFSSTSIQLNNSPFDEGESAFGTANENDFYQVSVRCVSFCSTGKVRLYKAGLWVNLDSLTKAEIYFRTSLGGQISLATSETGSRTQITASVFSNPTAYFQVNALIAGMDPGHVELMSQTSSDAGLNFANSEITPLDVTTNIKSMYRSPVISVSGSKRYYPLFTPGSNSLNIIDSALILRVQK